MNNMGTQDLPQKGSIFFDGLCILCSREIEHYRKQAGSERFIFLDITAPDFEAKNHGVDPFAVHKVMHVKDPSGTLHTGPDAFRAIWKELPRYQFLYRWTKGPTIRWLMSKGYSVFARIRPFLPRKKSDCAKSPYCEIKR